MSNNLKQIEHEDLSSCIPRSSKKVSTKNNEEKSDAMGLFHNHWPIDISIAPAGPRTRDNQFRFPMNMFRPASFV